MGTGAKSRNSTANNALEILNMFSTEQLVITAVQVSKHLGTSRSTAYRYLDTLVDMDYLAPAAGGGFRIGRRVQELAMLDRTSDKALALAREWMVRIRDEFDETVTYVTRLSGLRTVIRATEASRQLLKVTYELGTVMPLHAGAPSLVLLWADTDEQIAAAFREGEVSRYTDATPTTVEHVLDILRTIREQGYYVSRGEYDPDSVSVGVPVFGAGGTRPLAGLGVVLPATRSSAALEKSIVRRLREAAAAIRGGLEST